MELAKGWRGGEGCLVNVVHTCKYTHKHAHTHTWLRLYSYRSDSMDSLLPMAFFHTCLKACERVCACAWMCLTDVPCRVHKEGCLEERRFVKRHTLHVTYVTRHESHVTRHDVNESSHAATHLGARTTSLASAWLPAASVTSRVTRQVICHTSGHLSHVKLFVTSHSPLSSSAQEFQAASGYCCKHVTRHASRVTRRTQPTSPPTN